MHLSEEQISALVHAFLEENAKLNLSAFRTEEHVRIGNILDSLSLLDVIETSEVKSILDIGTGGGFPLLPLAMALPNARCVGMDSIEKKVNAIERIAATLGLTNTQLKMGRVEEWAHEGSLRSSFDIVTARAVAPMPVLLEYAVPFLRVNGLCALWKSTKIADELASTANAQKVLHAPYVKTHMYELPEDWGERTIVFFQKTQDTPNEYPRKTGAPKSKPL